MKSENMLNKAIGLLLVMIIALFSTATVFAEDLDGDGVDDEIVETVEPIYTEPENIEPVYTDPVTEYVEPATEYVEPETIAPFVEETTEYVEPETKTEEQTPQQQTEYIGNQEPQQQATTEFVAPTVVKTVSDKKYETNYTAGIVSWICVGVGILVVFVVLVSNKVSGGKAKRRT